jgi:dTDP-4-amino-4,6-dideoxygalactose transaminase
MDERMNKKIYLASPHMSSQGYEMAFVKEAFATNWIAPLGPNVDNFETEMCNYTGAKHAAALSSGTAAIHLSLKAAGVKKDDIVFCPSLTFSATANAIIYENAIPVFIDSDFKTWNMCPNALKKAFIKYPNVKAVLIVHIYGLSADCDPIINLCKENNVAIIEDAAESLGAKYKHKHTGTFGDYGIFSFNGNKIITTSGGGMAVCNDKEKIEKIKFWSTQSREKARHYEHNELGYNYRMSNVLAGIGRGQLKVLNERIKKKKYIFNFYKKEFTEIKEITFMPINDWNEPNYWLTCITIEAKLKPNDIISALEKENIEARPIWKPMHLQPYFAKYDFAGTQVSEYLFKNGLCLPSDTKMTDDDLNKIIKIIKNLFKY